MPSSRQVRITGAQVVWLIVIVAVGIGVGIAAGTWWGLGAAAAVLAVSEVIERMQRARSG